ncbi:MAG: hypothetical protein J4473_03495 [Candidatus Aenigmarchaeota archaeon]|nr:hypothetical protein [Candidatus Aenigmarchaeota archaeon]
MIRRDSMKYQALCEELSNYTDRELRIFVRGYVSAQTYAPYVIQALNQIGREYLAEQIVAENQYDPEVREVIKQWIWACR